MKALTVTLIFSQFKQYLFGEDVKHIEKIRIDNVGFIPI